MTKAPLFFWWNIASILVSCVVVLIFTTNGFASDILIYLTSHANNASVDENKGELKIAVSSMSPIERVEVNGKEQKIGSGKMKATVVVPYQLNKGENRFRVVVATGEETTEKIFTLVYAKEKGRSPFGLIVGLGGQQLSNATKVPEDQTQTSGTKGTLLLLPSYRVEIFPKGSLKFQLILYRELYDKQELEAYEAQFTQISASWVQELETTGSFEVGVGGNDIEGEYGFLHDQDNHKETDKYLFGAFKYHLSKDYKLGIRLGATDRDVKEKAENQHFEEDATVTDSQLSFSGKLTQAFSLSLKGGRQVVDAVGKYKDQSVVWYGIKLKLQLSALALSAGMKQKNTNYVEIDPIEGKQVEKVKSQFKMEAVIPFGASFMGMIDAKTERQTSNIKSSEYQNNQYGISLLYLL